MGEVLEFIIELVIELIVDGGIELTKSKKVSKWIRYPIVAIAGIVTIGILGFMLLLGYGLLDETALGGLIILGLTLLLLILTIRKLIKVYKEVKEEKNNLLAECHNENECLLDKYKAQKGLSPDLK